MTRARIAIAPRRSVALFAILLLWSLLPRGEKFLAPGLLVGRTEQPALFGELDDIASSLDEPVPGEVYLLGQVNAFVADRCGVLGFGSRRILAIGLPLLALLTVSEFRAVLAHEFAHYYSGDTRMGPREVGRIGFLQVMLHLVTLVLKWNFLFFLRVINFVSRRKEFRADELDCLAAGKEPRIGGMRKIHGAAMAWQAYGSTEALPILQSGYIPPLGDGLVRFLTAPRIAEQVARGVEMQLAEGKTNPYDTHPPLRDRIAAMEKMTADSQGQRDEPASSLLHDAEASELRWLESVNPKPSQGRVPAGEVG